MTVRQRLLAFTLVALAVMGATAAYGLGADTKQQEKLATAPPVAQVDYDAVSSVPHVVFRNTAVGDKYGLISLVPLSDPSGPRAVLDIACDRVDATSSASLCLRTNRGVATSFEADLLDSSWTETKSWALPGVPSRTRLSADGSLAATTSFVTGHSYMTAGFSTATTIRHVGGVDYGNLEDFTLMSGDQPITSANRNLWGVTFAPDANTFYATASFNNETWVVRGDLKTRTLTTLFAGGECPSLSPDGSQLAYKKNVGGASKHWPIAIRPIAGGREAVLAEPKSVDDQMEWLDDDTVLYGLPRDDEPGVTDVWSLDTGSHAQPELLIPQAWSPSVVR